MFDNKEIDGEILDKVINDNPHLRFLKIYGGTLILIC